MCINKHRAAHNDLLMKNKCCCHINDHIRIKYVFIYVCIYTTSIKYRKSKVQSNVSKKDKLNTIYIYMYMYIRIWYYTWFLILDMLYNRIVSYLSLLSLSLPVICLSFLYLDSKEERIWPRFSLIHSSLLSYLETLRAKWRAEVGARESLRSHLHLYWCDCLEDRAL